MDPNAGPSTPPSAPATRGSVDGSSVHRARELTAELRRLQESVEHLDAALLQDNVHKVRAQGCKEQH